MPGPWEKYAKAQPQSEGPWSKYQTAQTDEDGGILQDIAEGAAKVARTIDKYTGAPARAGIGALQDKKGVIEAIRATASQFGEDPENAPTEKQIREKAGIDIGDKPVLPPISSNAGRYIPIALLPRYILSKMSPNDAVEFGIGAGADVTNLIPVAGLAKKAIKGGVKGAEAALGATKTAVKKSGEIAAEIGKKVLSGATGVEKERINKYLADHDRLKDIVDTRSGISTIKDDIDATLEPLQTRVGDAKTAVAGAKERRAEELVRLADNQREAKEALRLAEQQRIGETAARVSGDVQRLNKEVSAGSEQAFRILDQEGVRVSVTPIKSDLTKGIKALEATSVTDEQMAVVDLLKRYRERLDKFGKDMPGGEAKRLIQSLDKEMRHLAPGEVGRLGREDQVMGIMRRRFDAPLKESGAYAKQMEGVAKDTRLLVSAEDMATESGAARALQAAARPTGADRSEVLKLLGERQGQNYLAAVDRSTLPEYQRLRGILQRYRAARKGPELQAAKRELDTAVAELAPFRSVAPNEFGKSGSEALIRNQLRPKTAGLDQQELLKTLDQKFGKNYSSQVEDLKTIAAFDKEFTRGSANTNFWAIATAAIGTFTGGAAGGVLGGALGAAFGRLVIDKFGPATARVILDQVPKLKGMAPTAWVKQLRVPEAVKNELLQELVASGVGKTVRSTTQAVRPFREVGMELRNVADQNGDTAPVATGGPDRWAYNGLEKLGINDSALADKLLQSKEGKQLLIEASDLAPGSKAMQRIMTKIEKWRQYGKESGTSTSAKVSGRERKPTGGREAVLLPGGDLNTTSNVHGQHRRRSKR